MNDEKWRATPGPWQGEPDRLEWRHNGLPCLARRNVHMGNWCGYVAIPPDHPLHGKHYDDMNLEAHGGLTYSGPCEGDICHAPQPGEPEDVWWIGFDCAHAWDETPAMVAMRRSWPDWPPKFEGHRPDETYRDLDFVKTMVNGLAEQVTAVAQGAHAPSNSTPNLG